MAGGNRRGRAARLAGPVGAGDRRGRAAVVRGADRPLPRHGRRGAGGHPRAAARGTGGRTAARRSDADPAGAAGDRTRLHSAAADARRRAAAADRDRRPAVARRRLRRRGRVRGIAAERRPRAVPARAPARPTRRRSSARSAASSGSRSARSASSPPAGCWPSGSTSRSPATTSAASPTRRSATRSSRSRSAGRWRSAGPTCRDSRHALEDMLGTRVAELPEPLRRVLLAVALGPDLTTGELATIADAVDDAIAAGLVVVDRDRVRASHPLLAAAAKQRSRSSERRAVHRALADVVAGAELRALHLALAADRADPELAATVSSAAATASARGARHEAVRLAEHALRLTPEDHPERDARLLALAHALEIARRGRPPDASCSSRWSTTCRPGSSAPRRACCSPRAGTSARSPSTTTTSTSRWPSAATIPCCAPTSSRRSRSTRAPAGVATMAVAEQLALDALAAAERAGPESERLGLTALAWVRAMTGQSVDELCERHRAPPRPRSTSSRGRSAIAGQRLVWRGEIEPRAGAARAAARARRRARRGELVRDHAPARDRARAARGLGGTRPSGCSTSGPSPPTSTC